jgi:hypothetical protein
VTPFSTCVVSQSADLPMYVSTTTSLAMATIRRLLDSDSSSSARYTWSGVMPISKPIFGNVGSWPQTFAWLRGKRAPNANAPATA